MRPRSFSLTVLAASVLVLVGVTLYMQAGRWVGARQPQYSLADCPREQPPQPPLDAEFAINFQDQSQRLGPRVHSKTFSLAVTDINRDGLDDILVGAHNHNPILYVNSGEAFSDASEALFPRPSRADHHGYTLADLDNDGDLDVAIAGGGSDGVGGGSPNVILRNVSGARQLAFTPVEISDALAVQPSRSRSLIPVASRDGSAVDLYLATLRRKDYPNQRFRNLPKEDGIGFARDDDDHFTLSIDDHGRGVFADFDADGNDDYLAVDGQYATLFWHPRSGREPSVLASGAYSVKAADFTNDGMLDIFIGRFSPDTHSDRVSHNPEQLIYVVRKHGEDDGDSVAFRAAAGKLRFDLAQHIRATADVRLDGAQDIFVGRDGFNPGSRRFTLDAARASGRPATMDAPGIYIWHEPGSDRWHMSWKFHESLDVFKGVVTGRGIDDVVTTNFVTTEPQVVNDLLLVNTGGGTFTPLCALDVTHQEKTVATTVADFNNDGWLDLVGVRHGEQGANNGSVFVLGNRQGRGFSLVELPIREIDRLHRANLVAHGMLDDDDKPDVVITNGFGQIPGTHGVTHLMLNRTGTPYGAVLVHLEGVSANRYAIGAKLTLEDAAGSNLGYRVVGLNTNLSQDSYWQHFGLGDSQGPYQLRVEWPDGPTTVHAVDGAGRYRIRQDEG